MQVHSKLAHLSAPQIADLLEKYDDPSIALKEIISEFSIQTTPSALSGILPPFTHEDSPCPHCRDVLLQSRRKRRSSYASPIGRCPNCGHQDTSYCTCRKCREAATKDRLRVEEIKRNVIHKNFGGRCWDGDFANLTLRDAVYLSALIRQSLSEDLATVAPYSPGPPTLAPTSDYNGEIVQHLRRKSLLAIDPDSRIEAFVFNAELTTADSYYPEKVGWLFLPGLDVADKRQFMLNLTAAIDGDWPDAWERDLPTLWRSIIKAEAFEYFFHMLDQRGYQLHNIGEKTHAVFDFLIERFPLSKMCNLIWQAVRDTTDYNVKNDIPTYQAKNNFVGAIQRKAEKYIAQGWDVNDSRRDFKCPQTWISSTFFDTFMKVGERGFTSMPPADSN
jgi:hypothetical protein